MVNLSINTSQLGTLATSESVHGIKANVETLAGMIDSQDVDLSALVFETVAATTVGRVPAGNDIDTANVGESRDIALGLPAVAGDETVLAVGAGD